MGELRITHRDGMICTAEWRTVYVVVFLEGGTLPSLEIMDREEGHFAKVHPKFSIFVIVPEVPIRRPPTGVGDKAADMFRRYGPQLVGAATVFSGKGFGASIARSIMSAAELFSKSAAPRKSVATIAEATEWLGQLPGQDASYDAGALATELEALLVELELA